LVVCTEKGLRLSQNQCGLLLLLVEPDIDKAKKTEKCNQTEDDARLALTSVRHVMAYGT
jgi:hypothetical protein